MLYICSCYKGSKRIYDRCCITESTVPALFSYARIPKFHTELYLNELKFTSHISNILNSIIETGQPVGNAKGLLQVAIQKFLYICPPVVSSLYTVMLLQNITNSVQLIDNCKNF